MAKNTYSCLHKPIKINRNKMYILLLLGQLCMGKVAFGVDHNLTTNGNYATTADVADGLALAGTGGQVDIKHKLTNNPGNHVLTSTNSALSTTINISKDGSIISDLDQDAIHLSNLDDTSTGVTINNMGDISVSDNASTGRAINLDNFDALLNLNNFGNIKGDIFLGTGKDIVNQISGVITGNIETGDGDDTITISGGSVVGNINLGAGQDTVNFRGGTLEGNIYGIEGNNTINYNSGNITGTIDGGDNNNIFNIYGDFTPGNTISKFQTINVNSPGKFTINKAVSNLDIGLTIQPGATVDVQAGGSISGTGTITNNQGNIRISPNTTNSIDVGIIENTGNLILGDPDPGVTDSVNIKCQVDNNPGSVTTLYSPVTITGDYTLNSDSEHQMYIKNGIASTVTADNVTFAPGSKIAIKTAGTTLPATGDIVTIATATGAAPEFDPAQVKIVSDKALIKYVPELIDSDIKATAAQKTYSEAVADILTNASPNVATVANILTTLAADPAKTPEVALSLAILAQSTPENFADNLDQIIPDLSVTRAADLSMQSSSMVLEQINDRIAQVSPNSTKFAGLSQQASGYAAGEFAAKQNYWIKAFGISSKQKALTESNGYNANLGGIALGLDKSVNSKLLLGASLSYASTKVKTKDVNPDRARIQSSQFTVYANYSQPQYYVNAYLGAGLNRYRTDRAVLGQNYHAKFNGIQPSVRVDVGMPKLINNINITPNASLQYNHLRQQKYSETGAGLALKNVDSKNTHLLRGGLGAKWEVAKVNAINCVIPEFRMMGWYDLINTQPQITTEFQGGNGSIFPLKGDKAKKFTFNLGASLNYVKTDGFSVSFNYDLYAKKKFIGHGGSLLAKFSM